MSYYTLNFQVEVGEISASHSVVTADSVEYITAAFTFDESWSDLIKTAIFRVGDVVYHVPLENDACKIPFEALKEPMMYVSVFGISDLVRATTLELPIQVQNSGYTVCEPQAPTPDPYNYFLEKATALKNETVAAVEKSIVDIETITDNLNKSNAILTEVKQAELNVDSMVNTIIDDTIESSENLREITKKAEYISKLTDEAAESARAAIDAEESILDNLTTHNSANNSLAHPNIFKIANEAKNIALGKANSLCFNTKTELLNWVSGTFERADGITVNDIKIGDNLYILETDAPDYWWDGENIQLLGCETPNLSDYYLKTEIDARISDLSFASLSQSEYDNRYLNGSLEAGKIYFVYEED